MQICYFLFIIYLLVTLVVFISWILMDSDRDPDSLLSLILSKKITICSIVSKILFFPEYLLWVFFMLLLDILFRILFWRYYD